MVETVETQAGHRVSRPAPRAVQVICLILAAYFAVQNVGALVWDWPFSPAVVGGTWGFKYLDNASPGSYLVKETVPGEPLDLAGVKAGDIIRFEHAMDIGRRSFPVGETADVTVIRNGRTWHVKLTSAPRKSLRLGGAAHWFEDLEALIGGLLGTFIVWRSQRRRSAIVLGMVLVCYGLIEVQPSIDFNSRIFFILGIYIGNITAATMSILIYDFSIGFYSEQVGRIRSWERLIFWCYASLEILSTVVDLTLLLLSRPPPKWVPDPGFMYYISFAACLIYLIRGLLKSSTAIRQRYAIILLATSTLLIAQTIFNVSWSLTSITFSDELGGALFGSALNIFVTYPLFAYAILRQRVFNLGFALNRTLVFTGVSAILLAAFGLIEWAVDHYLPVEGREKNALIDAAIALGVFLMFHRVRDVVEHGVETVLFRRWHHAEKELRRYVREAAFVRSPETLTRTFAQALSAFVDGAPSAIYLIGEDGQPRLAESAGGHVGPDQIDADDPTLVTLRAELKPLSIASEPSDTLAAPMVNRNEVTGMVLVGPKPDGLDFRPDEIELIGWATRQVGLDLRALEIERLTAKNTDLIRENETLRSLLPARG